MGLKAFNEIADHLHISFTNAYLFQNLLHSADVVELPTLRKQFLSCMRREVRVGTVKNEELLQFRAGLEKLLRTLDSQVGNLLQYNVSAEVASKENLRNPLIPVLRTTITCINRIPPTNIPTAELYNLIIKYSIHISPSVCIQAKKLLLALFKAHPRTRGALLAAVGHMAISVPEEASMFTPFLL